MKPQEATASCQECEWATGPDDEPRVKSARKKTLNSTLEREPSPKGDEPAEEGNNSVVREPGSRGRRFRGASRTLVDYFVYGHDCVV
jgi:hypothetical protein